MKIYETRIIPAHEDKFLVKRVCDLCGKEGKDDWDGCMYEVQETTVKVSVHYKNGESYPEGGCGKEYDIDICPDCFVSKLVPWLQLQGVNVAPHEYDY